MPKVKLCTSSFLFNTIQSYPDRFLVLDTRSAMSYQEKSLPYSLNLDRKEIKKQLDTLSLDKEKQETPTGDTTNTQLNFTTLQTLASPDWKTKLQNCKRCFCIIIFNNQDSISKCFKQANNPNKLISNHFVKESFHLQGAIDSCRDNDDIDADNDEDLDSIRFGMEIYNIFAEEKVRELYILIDGADKLFNTYPFLERKFKDNVKIPPPNIKYPNDILDGRLYLGDGQQGTNSTVVQQLKITHIVNCTLEINHEGESGVKYLKLPVKDEDDTFLAKYFNEAYDFIAEALSDENKVVLVHCALGKSRSASIVIMFLMKMFDCSYSDAHDYVKERRSLIKPNYGFVSQLEDFEKRHYKFKEEDLSTFSMQSICLV